MTKPYKIGLIADVQYADSDDALNWTKEKLRHYRHTLTHLKEAVTHWENENVDAIIQLGDFIDGRSRWTNSVDETLQTVLDAITRIGVPVHHSWGNHEFYCFKRKQLLERLFSGTSEDVRSGKSYYDFAFGSKYRFLSLDGYDVSVLGRDECDAEYSAAEALLKEHNPNADWNDATGITGYERRFRKFNGGFSDDQLCWVDQILSKADQAHETVILFCHLPINVETCTFGTLAFNYDELTTIMHRHPSCQLYLAGHDHNGGFTIDDKGIHHLTLPGIIEMGPGENSFATLELWDDKMSVKGVGQVPSFEITHDAMKARY